jgi:hypothetical protein
MPEELDPTAQHARQSLLQDIVRQVHDAHAGEDLETVLSALQGGLEEAGFPPQPEMWLEGTASEIAEGRHVVVDRHLAEGDDDRADGVPEAAGGSGAERGER